MEFMTSHHQPPQGAAGLLLGTFDALQNGIAVYDAQEKLVYCNQDFRRQLAPIAHLLEPGTAWRDILAGCIENDLAIGLADIDGDWRALCDGLRQSNERRTSMREWNGSFFDLSYNPLENGGFFITRTDVTEKVEAENRLREREALLSTVFDTNPSPVVMARMDDSKVVYLSPAARKLFGDVEFAADLYTSAEDRTNYINALKEKGQVRDRWFNARAGDGTLRAITASGEITDYDGVACVVSSITDMTEQLERDELIRLVIEACPAPFMMIRADTGEVLFRSPEAAALYGETDSARDFYVDQKDRADFVGEVRRHREVSEYRLRLYNAKGHPFWCAVSARLIQWGGEDVIVSHSRDLTGQLAIEQQLARQREQVFQSEKMSALGSLLAGVAHELNNPLSVVVGHAMMLSDETQDPEVLRQIQKISTAAERCSKIVRTFLTMARQEPVRMEPVDIGDLIETAVEVARYGNPGRRVRIETDIASNLPQLCADHDQITQAVVNLIINAEQAIEGAEVGDAVRVIAHHDAHNRRLEIAVEDNGPGIPSDIRARVFEPFFTTKGVGQGTGIGLAVCHRVVAAHKGKIEISDLAPQGTRFTISLPADRIDTPCSPEETPVPAETAPVRVLVIDDEVDVADLNVEVLRRGGYEADAVYEAEKAVDALRDGGYDVVLSDLNMPKVDGRGVFEAISTEFPDLASRTGFVTGDTMGRASQAFLQESRRPYIEKPVSPKELRAFVAELSKEGTPE